MAGKRKIDVSVLIATRNRAKSLQRTLDHLKNQKLQGIGWEVIVVDNGSIDNTSSVLNRTIGQLPLVHIYEPILGKNRALNKGLDVARGGLIVLTDDDVIPQSTWIAALDSAAHRWPTYSIFGGQIVPQFPAKTPQWLKENDFAWSKNLFSTYVPSDKEGPVEILPVGPNLAIRAQIFLEERFREDVGPKGKSYPVGGETELLERLSARGERFIYVPSASVGHVIREEQISLRWLLRRVFLCGRGGARRHPDRTSRQLFGVPRYLWRRLLVELVRFATTVYRNDQVRFEKGKLMYITLGQIYEYRKIAKQTSSIR